MPFNNKENIQKFKKLLGLLNMMVNYSKNTYILAECSAEI